MKFRHLTGYLLTATVLLTTTLPAFARPFHVQSTSIFKPITVSPRAIVRKNYQDNLTRRYEIKTGRCGQQVNQLLEDK